MSFSVLITPYFIVLNRIIIQYIFLQLVLYFIIKIDGPFLPNQLVELPASVEATSVILIIEKINQNSPALISNIVVKACIEGKLNASSK